MWVLIWITLSGGVSTAETHSFYRGMAECFEGRDQLLVDNQNYDGYFPAGYQAICLEIQ